MFFFFLREQQSAGWREKEIEETWKSGSVFLLLQDDCSLVSWSPSHTLIETPSQANSKLHAGYHSMRYTVRAVQHSAVCSLRTQYTALSPDGKNLPRRPQPLLCGRAANVLHVKEHFHVIHIHRSLSWSCPLGKFALSVVFSVNLIPHCCVSFSVSSSA